MLNSVKPAVCACAALLGIVASASAAATSSATPRHCGYVHEFVSVAATGVGCRTAESVARRYLDGRHRPLGFRCVKHDVNAAAGYYTICRKGRAQVDIVPE
jgi:hypothetical protein